MAIRRISRAHRGPIHRGRPRRGRLLPVLLAALVLVGGVNIAAYAANGKPLLLGRFNAEGRTAVVKNNGNGPALDLRSKPGAPSLKVSNARKVPRLNADKVDGNDARALQTQAYTFRLSQNDPLTTLDVPLDVPPGRYLATYSLLVEETPGCYFRPPGGGQAGGWGYSVPGAGTILHSVSGSTIIDTRGANGLFHLRCSYATEFILSSDLSVVSLVALDRVQTGEVVIE